MRSSQALVVVAPDRFCTIPTPHRHLTNTTSTHTVVLVPAIHVISSPAERNRSIHNRRIVLSSYPSRAIEVVDAKHHHHRRHRPTSQPQLSHHHTSSEGHKLPYYHTHLDIAEDLRAQRRDGPLPNTYIPPHIQGLLAFISSLRKRAQLIPHAPTHASTTHQSMNIASSSGILLPSLPVPLAAPPRPA